MISEFEFYHGVALAKLLHGHNNAISLATYSSPGNASYVINGKTGLYIKHSTKRMSPWRFTFKKEHQDEIKTLKDTYGHIFTVFVCGKDGVVVLNYMELKMVLDQIHDQHEWISIYRNRGQEYRVNGSDGKLLWKIAKNEFPSKITKQLSS